MKTVKEISHISGISVRTLHYYDEIDLLPPSFVGENGYRYYDDESLIKLQEILLFKELEFPLK
ncbi:MerR family transcriptional regulator, partial [Streptococcus agalactiae]|nr:MerR family transcriptional regulator [Streptococcus agalactiae]MCK6288403.1 MerR family transcriptional regulator [Streptococcus agalactiae]